MDYSGEFLQDNEGSQLASALLPRQKARKLIGIPQEIISKKDDTARPVETIWLAPISTVDPDRGRGPTKFGGSTGPSRILRDYSNLDSQ